MVSIRLVFGVARGLPLLAVGAAAEAIARAPRSMQWLPKIEYGSGILLLLAGI